MNTRMIQIRHVPEDVHRTLKARAALQGLSLSDFLRRELASLAAHPTVGEWLQDIARREPVSDLDIVEALRAERERV